jgi:site-specific DNA-methyltransferase (cytosine-N4-specific)
VKPFFKTSLGKLYLGESLSLINSHLLREYEGKVQLIITSPPFPLNKKKKYGNFQGEEYKQWLLQFAPLFSRLLTKNGSIVMELGNAWEPARPVQSFLPLESLLGFVKHPEAKLNLCQEFICYNPSRLPSPAAWVTVQRIRMIDSYTHVWWMSKTDFPKADNKKVLRPYSKSMKSLLKRGKYNAGERPSEHRIGGTSFLRNHHGSIMPNFIELEQIDESREHRLPENILSLSNTCSSDYFLKKCREKGIKPHPARMSPALVAFFIEFLTEKGDLVLDPFAGSNTTGYCAEKSSRRWVSLEIDEGYAQQGRIRFKDGRLSQPKK